MSDEPKNDAAEGEPKPGPGSGRRPGYRVTPEHRARLKQGRETARLNREAKIAAREAARRDAEARRLAGGETAAPIRGPGADQAESVREERTVEAAVMPVRRTSRSGLGFSGLDIPRKYQRPGWDYAFFPVKVTGAPVEDIAFHLSPVALADGGWRQVKTREMPDKMPVGTDLDAPVIIGGQAVYTRPIQLSSEAKQENYDLAQSQLRDRTRATMGGRSIGGEEGLRDIRGVVSRVTEFDNYGEVGSFGRKE
jgi:hypothetical protein